MILLISSKYDVSTNNVVRWLNYYGINYVRLNTEDFNPLNHFSLSNKSSKLTINDIDISTITAVWHRRGRLRHVPNSLNNLGKVTDYLKKEEDSLVKSIETYLRSTKKYIGSYTSEVENYKLEHLMMAKECGLNIPNSIITTSKKDLIGFYNSHSQIISKDLRYPINIKTSDVSINSIGTFKVTDELIQGLDEQFAPIYAQEYIEKEFEIRVFYFERRFFSMGIFSQHDEQTQVDYRNYNTQIPNRCVPINLPLDIEKQLLSFTDKIKLNTGSIDFIYSTDERYIFLEVNPMGQFDWLSKNCNYHIEREIAKEFMEV
ncbi:grasp-with-spasm system ATP-grasp peptide maturase [uncultured Kordia sp.]|uniref:grasp-with-spasm system ATP-grasp peptide maturase n=1 Tax=uncultured Kordia sp. TaxID=507699 RepID=UPI00262234E0|nr:grasp-with-spasm system ATP-grasp peptide maturase [uncultured Kordia sp.]